MVLLAWGRSHRTTTDAELIRWGADVARVEGRAGAETIEVALVRPAPAIGGARRPASGSGSTASPAGRRRSSGLLRAVLFAPEEMLLVVGSPGLRRAALDQLAAQRSAGLPARPRDLRPDAPAAEQPAAGDPRGAGRRATSCGSGTDRSSRPAAAIVAEPGCGSSHDLAGAAGRGPRGDRARGGGRGAPWRSATRRTRRHSPGESPRDALARRLAETAEKEVWNGSTLVGPHRDDLVFELGGRDLAGFASRGQQRTAILAFKLAELDLLTAQDGRPPLLLLDDVFSELDPERRAHLVRRIAELPQAFVTTTTLDDLDPALVAAATPWEVDRRRRRRRPARRRPRHGRPVTGSRRRPMTRIGDLLPDAARGLGLEDELRLSRAMATFEAIVAERVPAAAGACRVLRIEGFDLVVEADAPIVAQELRLRSRRAPRGASRPSPAGVGARDLRVHVRRAGPRV